MADDARLRARRTRRPIVQLIEAPDGEVGFVFPGGDGDARRAPGLAGRGGRPWVLVPTAAVLLTEVRVPPAAVAKRARAIPFVLEERIAGAVDEQHVALDAEALRGRSPVIPVAVVSRARMVRWTQALAAAGIAYAGLVPDVLALPWEPRSVTVLVADETAWVRYGRQLGFASEPDGMSPLLARALSQAPAGARVRVLDARSAPRRHEPLRFTMGDAPVALEHRPGGPMIWLDGGWSGAPPVDLAQGEFGPRRSAWSSIGSSRWRIAAALVIAIGLTRGGIGALQAHERRLDVQRIEARIHAVLDESWPGVPRSAVRSRVTESLQALRADVAARRGRFLALLAASAPALSEDAEVRMRSIEFRDGRLLIGLEAESVEVFEAVVRRLQAQSLGLGLEVVSVRARDGRFEGGLRLWSPGS